MAKSSKTLDSFVEGLKKSKKKREKIIEDMTRIVFDEFRKNPYVGTFTKSEESAKKLLEYILTNKL